MNNSPARDLRARSRWGNSTLLIVIVTASLIALVSTFVFANSTIDLVEKSVGFGAIVVVFLTVCLVAYLAQSRRGIPAQDGLVTDQTGVEIERKLISLDDANEFFAGTLNSADTFRLVASRVNGLIPFQAIELITLDKTRSKLIVAESEGSETDGRKGSILDLGDSLAGHSFTSRLVESGYDTLACGTVHSGVAVPLMHGVDVFGVLQIYFDNEHEISAEDIELFEAIGVRAAPLILSSLSLERSRQNALTDFTTELPNERAFYVVLENQIAEAMRKREDRPLTILSIDIKNFDSINSRFGHASGDRVLNYVAQTVKDNLRQMDFFARSMNDEFLAVLPTASKEVSREVIARIHTGFFGRKLKLNESDIVEIDVNFGWAAFGADGETPEQLLSIARLRREQSKSGAPNKVLWFSKELIN